MLENKVKAEKTFFLYSYHCSENLLTGGSITQKKYDEVTIYFNQGKTPPRQLLEEVYPNAVRRIKEYADKKGVSPWSTQAIRDYFLKHHNEIIDRGEDAYGTLRYTTEMKELCKVYVVEIKNKEVRNSHTFYGVKQDDKEFKVVGDFVPYAEIGDKVSIHYKFAIEKISENYNK